MRVPGVTRRILLMAPVRPLYDGLEIGRESEFFPDVSKKCFFDRTHLIFLLWNKKDYRYKKFSATYKKIQFAKGNLVI